MTLKSQWSEAQKLEQDKENLFAIKMGCWIVTSSNLFFMLGDTLGKVYANEIWYWIYWGLWIAMTIVLIFSHIKEKPHLVRFVVNILIIRNIVPWFNFEDRKKWDDIGNIIQYNQPQTIAVLALIIVMSLQESAAFYIPVSALYQFFMCWGQFVIYYQKTGHENYLMYSLKKRIVHIIMNMIVSFLLAQTCSIYVVKKNKLDARESTTQLSVAQISLKKVVNHLNEAIILKNKEGNIGFCNDLGIRLIHKVASGAFTNEKSFTSFLARINSMDFLSEHLFSNKKSDKAQM